LGNPRVEIKLRDDERSVVIDEMKGSEKIEGENDGTEVRRISEETRFQ
uniref:Flagellar motor switch protein FliN n=1 Tax=Anisakis simplex TaxID=6269 RepID=A0A0M3JL62_ANISI